MIAMLRLALLGLLLLPGAVSAADSASTDPNGNPKAVKQQSDKMWVDANGTPTFHIAPDGTVGWYTYYGYIQYSANCLQCHGPDGLGTSYGPNLTDALKHLTYAQFLGTVAQGKKNVSASQNLVMPSFGTDKNVMCYINEIYVYLRARADGALGRGRPEKHAPLPKGFNQQVDACFG